MTSRVVWRGVTVDGRTARMLDEAAELVGPLYLHPTQGSFSGRVSASAGTHDGCGAVDLMHGSWTVADYDRVVRELRRVGFAAWHRTPQQSSWPRHVHAVAVQPGGRLDRGCLSAGAHAQVVDYFDGRNGLASRAPDDGPRTHVGVTWETYQETNMALSDDDVDRIARAVLNGITWKFKGDAEPQSLRQHVTELRRDLTTVRDRQKNG